MLKTEKNVQEFDSNNAVGAGCNEIPIVAPHSVT